MNNSYCGEPELVSIYRNLCPRPHRQLKDDGFRAKTCKPVSWFSFLAKATLGFSRNTFKAKSAKIPNSLN